MEPFFTRRSRYTFQTRGKEKKKRRQRGGSIGTVLSTAAKAGYELGKSKKYHRMSFSGFSDSGGNRFRRQPWAYV